MIDFDDVALKIAKLEADNKISLEALLAIHRKTYAFENPIESQQYAHKVSAEALQTILPEIREKLAEAKRTNNGSD